MRSLAPAAGLRAEPGSNLGWHPRAEEMLWTPETEEPKRSQTGGWNVRYKRGMKGKMVSHFKDLVGAHLPGCEIRYAF